MSIDEITGLVLDGAMRVHSTLGPGLLESVYEKCLVHELRSRKLRVETQVWLPVIPWAASTTGPLRPQTANVRSPPSITTDLISGGGNVTAFIRAGPGRSHHATHHDRRSTKVFRRSKEPKAVRH